MIKEQYKDIFHNIKTFRIMFEISCAMKIFFE